MQQVDGPGGGGEADLGSHLLLGRSSTSDLYWHHQDYNRTNVELRTRTRQGDVAKASLPIVTQRARAKLLVKVETFPRYCPVQQATRRNISRLKYKVVNDQINQQLASEENLFTC